MRTARGFASDAIFPEKLAGLLARLDPGGGEHLRLAALAAAQSVVRGDVCADLRSLSGSVFPDGGVCPPFAEWVEELSKSPVVGRPGDFRPLVIDGAGRLYLYGYHRRESFVAGEISRKALFDFPAGRECELSAALASLLGKSSDSPDLQRVAALNSALRRFSVISGGPGTGKTYTVARAAALLLMVYGENLKMAVCAPTGKAAGRLGEALSGAVESLECPEWVKERLPREVFTIHRLLGMGREGERFRFNANNPLPHDVVVVDEASMVDLTLMADLFAALGRDARVILSGDRDQLSSVEAGALLGDIASVPEAAAYSPQAASFIKEAAGDEVNLCSLPSSPLRDSVTILEKSRRFSSASAIGRAARAILTGGECDEAYRLLGGFFGGSREFGEILAEKALAGYELLLEASSPVEALSALNSFRVLCAVRKGPR
ncbi:exodeoxyribonuclease V subunit alpha, partial [bacterium]